MVKLYIYFGICFHRLGGKFNIFFILVIFTNSYNELVRVNLSRNFLSELCSFFPLALGSLDISNNIGIVETDYPFIAKSHILRLFVSIDVEAKDFVRFVIK